MEKVEMDSEKAVTHITQLNDHVLLEILTWLDIFDAINFIKCCKRMQNLEEIFNKKFSNFDFTKIDRRLTLAEVNQLLHLVGESLTKLDLFDIKTKFQNGDSIMQAVQKQCHKLQELNLSLPYFAMLKRPLPRGLRLLSISSYELENDSVAEKFINGSWQSLQCIRMFDMMNLDGIFLDKFENLQQLQLENCEKLNQNNLINCCRQNKTLRMLKIVSCPQINEHFVEKVCTLLHKLEVLHLDIFTKAKKICCSPLNQLDNIRVLRIALLGTDSTMFVNSLISTICTKNLLQELYIGGTAKLEPQNVQNFMKMTNLRKLEFFNCDFIDKKFLLTIGDLPLTDVTFTRIQFLNDNALLAFVVKTKSLERLRTLLCPVSVKVKAEIAATIQQCVVDGNRSPLTVCLERAFQTNNNNSQLHQPELRLFVFNFCLFYVVFACYLYFVPFFLIRSYHGEHELEFIKCLSK